MGSKVTVSIRLRNRILTLLLRHIDKNTPPIILLRIRQIKLDVDLGQSISTVILDLKDSILRTKLTEVTHELSLSVGDVSVMAKGNVAGKANVSNCVFQTIRRIENPVDDAAHNRMLELRMTSGPFIVVLESEHQKLLHYR